MSKQLDDLLLKQEIFWRQSSRVSWLKYGDRNTNFFSFQGLPTKAKEFIKGIKNANGVWVEEVDDVVDVAANYFMDIFTTSTGDRMEECLNKVNKKITDDMMEVLSRPYSNEEVKVVLF